jgi:hypothetical protein
MAMTGKNRIMIYEGGGRGAGHLDPPHRVRGDPAFPRAHALRAICARRSVSELFVPRSRPCWSSPTAIVHGALTGCLSCGSWVRLPSDTSRVPDKLEKKAPGERGSISTGA